MTPLEIILSCTTGLGWIVALYYAFQTDKWRPERDKRGRFR